MTDKLPAVVTELTNEAHMARAMLLGLWFDDRDHSYNSQNSDVMLNADTLEPITVHESMMRIKAWDEKHK